MSPPLPRRFRTMPILLAAGLLLGGGTLASCATRAEGRKAPPVQGETWLALSGSDAPVAMEGHWALIVFLRNDVVRCHEQAAEAQGFLDGFGPRGLVVLGVTPEPEEAATAYIRRHGVGFPLLADADPVRKAWGLPAIWENRYYLVDPEGVVIAQDDLPAIRRILERNLPK